jgi:DNA-binding transcriptional LysR family regulator
VNFRTLDVNLLRVFGAVMVERNVTRAAVQLAMTQPAVSNALRRLREATGDELFVTVPSGVVPTAQAEAWWPEVSASLDALRKVFDPQVFEPTRDERSFALAMADATATVLMPALVAALVGRHARSDLRVLPLVSRDPRPQLEQGSADPRWASSRPSRTSSPPRVAGQWWCSSRSTAASTSAACGTITRSPARRC